jgi:hypothetical protein
MSLERWGYSLSCPLALLASLLFASVTTAEVPPAPVWLAQDGYSFNLVSNKGWRVTATPAGSGPAKQVYLWGKGDPNASTGYERQDKAYIWAQVCTDAAQQLILRRSLYLPGPAKTFGARFAPMFYGTIASVRVYINGTLAFSFNDGYKHIPRTANAYAKLFRYGANDIEIRVNKRAKSRYQGFCRQGTPAKQIGLDFDLSGEFEANVSMAKGFRGGTDHRYFEVEDESTRLIVGIPNRYGAMINLGPSGVYDSIFQVNVESSSATVKLDISEFSVIGRQLKNC